MQNEIKASELRIGNYIYDDFNEIHVVEHIESQRFNDWNGSDPSLVVFSKLDPNDKGMYSCDVVTGIPLNHHVLYKCGFKCDIMDRFIHNDGFFTIVWTGNQYFYRDYLPNSPEIKYLHQLQNLYFALTNQELNIEL